ncbi:unnamed protein product, partial [Cylicostephanus goldi]
MLREAVVIKTYSDCGASALHPGDIDVAVLLHKALMLHVGNEVALEEGEVAVLLQLIGFVVTRRSDQGGGCDWRLSESSTWSTVDFDWPPLIGQHGKS